MNTKWQQILAEIQAHGMTQVEIAKACGCTQTTISDIKRGETTVPRYSTCVVLLDLQKKLSLKRQAA